MTLLWELPDDLLLEILLVLSDPHDLLALQLTCSRLNAFVNSRTVWLNILRNLCSVHGAPAPKSEWDTSSLEDIKKAAVRPYCFASKLSSDDPKPFRERTLFFHDPMSPPSDSRMSQGLAISCIKVIPGGRYILVEARGMASIWDMGSAHEQPVLIVWTHAQERGNVLHSDFVPLSSSSKGFFVVTTEPGRPTDLGDHCTIYDVDLGSQIQGPLTGESFRIRHRSRSSTASITVDNELIQLWVYVDMVLFRRQGEPSYWGALQPAAFEHDSPSSNGTCIHEASYMGDGLIAMWVGPWTHSSSMYTEYALFDIPATYSSWQEAVEHPNTKPILIDMGREAGVRFMPDVIFQPATSGNDESSLRETILLRQEALPKYGENVKMELYGVSRSRGRADDEVGVKKSQSHLPQYLETVTTPVMHSWPPAPKYIVIGSSILVFDTAFYDGSISDKLFAWRVSRSLVPTINESYREVAGLSDADDSNWCVDPWRGRVYYGQILDHHMHEDVTQRRMGDIRVLEFLDD